MFRLTVFFGSFVLTTACVVAGARCRQESIKPGVAAELACPTDAVTAGGPATVSIEVKGVAPGAKIEYEWGVSAGSIKSGQGTPSMEVDTTGLEGQNVTVSLKLKGGPAGLKSDYTCTLFVAPRPPQAMKFDEFPAADLTAFFSRRRRPSRTQRGGSAGLTDDDMAARLDNFAVELQNDPTAQGYIVAVAPRREGVATEAEAGRLKTYMVENRGIDPARFVLLLLEQREGAVVQLWAVPSGAEPPGSKP